MKANDIKAMLVQGLHNCGAHQDWRGYLGMSGIGRCPREQYWNTMDPKPGDLRLKWYGWTGYLHEAAVKVLLGDYRSGMLTFLGNVQPMGKELIAEFDPRYRGHTDYWLPSGTLIEIKSTNWRRFRRVVDENEATPEHVAQVQAYMRHGHGDYFDAIIIYVARDTPHREWDLEFWQRNPLPFWCIDVARDETMMDALDKKAKRILAAMDRKEPPECECGRCER